MSKNMELKVIGLSFHIGSWNEDYEAYGKAIQIARRLFDEAEEIGFKFTFLDIGGGFLGHNFEAINSFSTLINSSLDEEFLADEFPIFQSFPSLALISLNQLSLWLLKYTPGIFWSNRSCIIWVKGYFPHFWELYWWDFNLLLLIQQNLKFSIPQGPDTFDPIVLKYNLKRHLETHSTRKIILLGSPK
jgi:hypothetical protein